MKEYDVIVVGAGPAGATAACVCAEAGLAVLLLDRARFPRDKVCGDAISGKSVDVLQNLGLLERVEQAESIDSWGIVFSNPAGDSVEIPFTRDEHRLRPPGYVCARKSFDHLLVERAVTKGVDLREECQVDDLILVAGSVKGVRVREVTSRVRNEDVGAPLVIGADGAYSVVARRLGMNQLNERHYYAGVRAYYRGVTGCHPRHFIELHFVDEAIPGYFWIFPMRDGLVNVGLGTLSARVKKHGLRLRSLLEDVLRGPRFADRFRAAEPVANSKGWGMPLGSAPRKMAGSGWLLAGDAASLIDPFTGEGIGNAMVSGDLAGRWAVRAAEAGDWSRGFLHGYQKAVHDVLDDELRLSYTLRRLERWRWLLNGVIRKAANHSDVADAISSMFNDLEQRRKLTSPSFYFRVLTA